MWRHFYTFVAFEDSRILECGATSTHLSLLRIPVFWNAAPLLHICHFWGFPYSGMWRHFYTFVAFEDSRILECGATSTHLSLLRIPVFWNVAPLLHICRFWGFPYSGMRRHFYTFVTFEDSRILECGATSTHLSLLRIPVFCNAALLLNICRFWGFPYSGMWRHFYTFVTFEDSRIL